MTPNLNEFLGMVGIVTNATLFILIFRWGIYKLGRLDPEMRESVETRPDSAK